MRVTVPPQISMLEIGRAAEHLVVTDLIMQGVPAFLTDQGLPYDVVADVEGRLLRVQVKANIKPRNLSSKGRAERIAYSFCVRRVGKKGRSRLSDKDCDIVALVALDLRVVAYLPVTKCGQTVQMDAPGGRMARVGRSDPKLQFHRSIAEYPFEEAVHAA